MSSDAFPLNAFRPRRDAITETLVARIALLEDLLKRMQWGRGVRAESYCDWCYQGPEEGHADNCELGKALAGKE